MFDDPAVRSVRVALALCDRFTELLKGPTHVRSAKQHGALIGVSGDEEGLSMRIGEAQQIYPEIWRHLDDARTAFSARGTDVSTFDAIREAEGQGMGANVDVQGRRYGSGSHGVDERLKSAGFNREGLVRARKAIEALTKATPEIPWAAIAKAEASDPAAADFARSVRTKRLVRLCLLALVVASPFLIVTYMRHQEREKRAEYARKYAREHEAPSQPPLPDAERTALAARVTELQRQLATARAAWTEQVTEAALAKTLPGSQPCEYKLTPPPQAAADAFVRHDANDPRAFAGSDFEAYVASAGDAAVRDYTLAGQADRVSSVARRIAGGKIDASAVGEIAALAPYITFVIIDREDKPAITGTGRDLAYTPGQVTARGYVFSVRAAKIVCAAAIEARNTPDAYLDAARTGDAAAVLHREIEIEIRKSLATNLRATN